jgi:hypothetical protein
MTHIKKLMFVFLAAVLGLTSCLKEDKMNIDPENTTPNVLTLQWIEAGSGSTINSGMQYFAGGTLLYPASHEADTATFSVQLSGAATLDHDINLKVGLDDSKLLVNYPNDSIEYEAMPDSLYEFINDSYTLQAGERVATFQVIFFPAKIDPTKNYMLPVTVVENGGVDVSQNYGHIFFHTIGNPLAGAYFWDYIRYNSQGQDPTQGPTGWEGDETSFTPVSGTVVKVPTGYYTQPDYLISFKDDGAGNLTDFAAVIDPAQIADYFTAGGVAIIAGPDITVNADYTRFSINYVVFNGTAYRNITDVFYR